METFTRVRRRCRGRQVSMKDLVFRYVPFLNVLRTYEHRSDLVPDVLCGVTMGLLHVPSGMATALAGGLPPFVGIYTAFFATLPHVFFAVNTHISVQPSLLASFFFNENMNQGVNLIVTNSTGNVSSIFDGDDGKVKMSTVVLFYSGVMYLLMHVFRLGLISWFISEPVQEGFLCGIMLVISINQLQKMFGIRIQQIGGPLSFFFNVVEFAKSIPKLNLACLICSSVYIIVVAFVKVCVNKRLVQNGRMTVPIELIIIITAVTVSYFADLNAVFKVPIVGFIPRGFPVPTTPKIQEGLTYIPSTIAFAIMNLTTFSIMLNVFAELHPYKVDLNQELFGLGISSIAASFFPCMPTAGSFFTTVVMTSMGGRTMVAHMFASIVVLVIFVAIGQVLEPLPECILASLIMLTIVPYLRYFKRIMHFWKTSRYDAVVWLVTFISALCYSITAGLLIGIVVHMVLFFYRMQMTQVHVIENDHLCEDVDPDTNIFATLNRKIHMVVVKYEAPITFCNAELFISKMVKIALQTKRQKEDTIKEISIWNTGANLSQNKVDIKSRRRNDVEPDDIKYPAFYVILDCSAISCLDGSGAAALNKVRHKFQRKNITLLLVSCTKANENLFKMCVEQHEEDCPFMYPSIMKAARAIEKQLHDHLMSDEADNVELTYL